MSTRQNGLKFIIYICIIFVLNIACKEGEKMTETIEPLKSLSEVSGSLLKKLSEKKVYFGHQSVGFNIIDGLKNVIKDNSGISLYLVETANISNFKSPIFAHSQNGKNYNPNSKVDAFVDLMENGLGNNVDIAFFKYCFVDIEADTDVEKVLKYYKSKLFNLKKKYPDTKFVHFTVPLVTKPNWIKGIIKDIIGKNHNANRHMFNEFLKKEFQNKNIFDLAKFESTYPDGKRELNKKRDQVYYSLVPDYSDDGGHLNKKGGKIIAEQLLIYLSSIVE